MKSSFKIGNYTCTIGVDTDLILTAGIARAKFEWAPTVPEFSRFTPKEMAAYRSHRDAFLLKVSETLPRQVH
jgi:hypothetical protein